MKFPEFISLEIRRSTWIKQQNYTVLCIENITIISKVEEKSKETHLYLAAGQILNHLTTVTYQNPPKNKFTWHFKSCKDVNM